MEHIWRPASLFGRAQISVSWNILEEPKSKLMEGELGETAIRYSAIHPSTIYLCVEACGKYCIISWLIWKASQLQWREALSHGMKSRHSSRFRR